MHDDPREDLLTLTAKPVPGPSLTQPAPQPALTPGFAPRQAGKAPIPTARSSSWWQRPIPLGPLITVQLLLVILAMAVPLLRLAVPISRDYSEGWLAAWSSLAATDPAALYRLAQGNPFLANNYPPLFLLLAGHLAPLVGDAVLAGRLLGLIGLGACAGMTALLTQRLGTQWRWSLVAALAVLLYAALPFDQFLAASNPQWPALALVLGAIYPLLVPSPTRRAMALSLLCFGLAMLTKHNLLAFVPATLVWCARCHRPLLAHWLLSGALAALVIAGGLQWTFGTAIWQQVFGFPRLFEAANARDGLLNLARFSPLWGVALVLCWQRRAQGPWTLLGIWLLFALVLGMVQRLVAGVAQNAFFEPVVAALVICAGSLGRGQPPAWRSGLMLAPLLFTAPDRLIMRWEEWQGAQAAERAQRAATALVAAAKGPVLCEDLATCYWGGKPLTLDFFAYGQRLGSGTSPQGLIERLNAREPALIVVDGNLAKGPGGWRLPAPLPALIEQTYRPIPLPPSGHLAVYQPSQRVMSRSAGVTQPR